MIDTNIKAFFFSDRQIHRNVYFDNWWASAVTGAQFRFNPKQIKNMADKSEYQKIKGVLGVKQDLVPNLWKCIL